MAFRQSLSARPSGEAFRHGGTPGMHGTKSSEEVCLELRWGLLACQPHGSQDTRMPGLPLIAVLILCSSVCDARRSFRCEERWEMLGVIGRQARSVRYGGSRSAEERRGYGACCSGATRRCSKSNETAKDTLDSLARLPDACERVRSKFSSKPRRSLTKTEPLISQHLDTREGENDISGKDPQSCQAPTGTRFIDTASTGRYILLHGSLRLHERLRFVERSEAGIGAT